MSLLRYVVCVACVAAAFVRCAPAQTPPSNEVPPSESAMRSWLGSGNPQQVAWGAHDALVARDRNLIPDLLSLAGRWQPLPQPTSGASPVLPPEQMAERAAMAAVLDALIQMNAPVPADTLRALAPDFSNSVAILLARMPDQESGPLAFDFYRSPSEHGYGLQYVSAALLALHPPPGFTVDLLTNLRVRATVTVVVPGSQTLGFGSSSSCGLGGDFPQNEWPLTGQYRLSTERSDGDSLVVGGVDPIYASRWLSANYHGDDCGMSVHLGPEGRRGLVAEMLGVSPEAIQWRAYVATTIEFRSVQQLEIDLLAFVEEQQAMYRATATALAERNLLLPSDVHEALPELELVLEDARGKGFEPIPRFSLPTHVECASSP